MRSQAKGSRPHLLAAKAVSAGEEQMEGQPGYKERIEAHSRSVLTVMDARSRSLA